MALPPLHQNTWRTERILLVGKIFISVTLAEDPKKPLWKRQWGFQNKKGDHQTNMIFLVGTELFELSDGHIARGLTLTVGPIRISASWV